MAALVVATVVAATLALHVAGPPWAGPGSAAGDPAAPPNEQGTAEWARGGFLDGYVDDDGRVVRHDEGGDSVSEGQAYAMLVAVAAADQERFDAIWGWTRTHLLRQDGLLSWRWAEGEVVDPESAADADLDVARALLAAAREFGDEAYEREARDLADAVMEHLTVETDLGRVLVAGTWVDAEPYAVNPSYFAPRTGQLLADLTDDPRWEELNEGSRAVLEDLLRTSPLPPDWALIHAGGEVTPAAAPDGTEAQFGLDAARVTIRHAESCEAVDVEIAASLATHLPQVEDDGAAAYDLGGSPLVSWSHPVIIAAGASAHAADRDEDQARALLERTTELAEDEPTYYGWAWAALAPEMLSPGPLDSCLGGEPG